MPTVLAKKGRTATCIGRRTIVPRRIPSSAVAARAATILAATDLVGPRLPAAVLRPTGGTVVRRHRAPAPVVRTLLMLTMPRAIITPTMPNADRTAVTLGTPHVARTDTTFATQFEARMAMAAHTLTVVTGAVLTGAVLKIVDTTVVK
jgi:hypothetical protein